MKSKAKKYLALLLVFTVLATGFITSCGKTEETAPAEQTETAEVDETPEETAKELSFEPGTYTGEADGFGGTFQVEVEVDESSIVDIKVLDNNETLGIGTTALEIMSEDMLEYQSTGVDAVAGCTFSSAAMRTAVNNALKESGADMSLVQKAPQKPEPSTEVKEIDTDVLVIGGGGSGMSAAIAAKEHGVDVLLVEKMQFLGGAASISGGQVNAGNSNYQKEMGVADDSVQLIAEDLYIGGNDLNDPTLVKLYSENVGRVFDWLHDDLGVEFSEEPTVYAEHRVPRAFAGVGGAPGINDSVKKALESSGVEVMLHTEVTEFMLDGENVIGATAIGADGTTYNITADTTVLCSGGYGYNDDLLPDYLQETMYYGPVSSTGDGLIMAQELGAKTQMLEYGKVYPNGFEIAPGIGRSTIAANMAVFADSGAILVDRNGERVVNERGLGSDIRDALYDQDDKTLFLVMDEDAFELFREKLNSEKYANNSEIDSWLENNGENFPVFAHGATIEEAAEAAGVDGAVLKATLENYKAMVDTDEDTEFGRELTGALADDSAQYYLVEQKPRFATTLGGLVINENMQVLNEEDDVIRGLLAAGEVVGGVHGNDSMPSVAVSWAFTSGNIAGGKAAGTQIEEDAEVETEAETEQEETEDAA